MAIQLLPPRLANQIAAGEVVERPASVVKELLENSLDAGATKIELDIEKGGHKRIRLRDNGAGIVKDELELALSRHATSKIATLNDLDRILSLGFRGEALASISSVSRLVLTSKPVAQEQAWQACCEGREMSVVVSPAAHPDGTTIDVADLFYNTPARRKFLRTEKTEFQHIEDVVKRIALSHPHVTCVLRHNGKPVKRFPGVSQDNYPQRIAAVVGQRFIDNAVYIAIEHQGMKIQAWLGNENAMRSSTDCQFSFVNGRGMRDKLILHAIRQAYESVLGVLEQPSFVFYFDIDPYEVDVNVHPAKHEVRFQQSRLVHDFICKAVCDALAPEHSDFAEKARPAPQHDYIRPLQSVRPVEEKIADRQSAYRAEGTFKTTSASPATRNEKQYQQNYLSLMSANSDIAQPEIESANALQLSADWRIYHDKVDCWLISIAPILTQWLINILSAASTSQPLLMPVAVKAENVCEATLSTLQQAHFEVGKVAGKYRLQQVPAGCRHLPWMTLFPAMLNAEVDSVAALCQHLEATHVTWPEGVKATVWEWLETQSAEQRWEWVKKTGKTRSLQELVDWW
ncbi:DNA mismatch repair endonuclease MutL [Alteromonas pelagimontana]|uniref:DNA mismatch repair protein MutL n=1 Tax=Alteromonas pelagimontana TaxID=1858656 RepID=A0A6M4ME48_9ALTE|nr:DNA mismatch repair endonuclease MutL [Alteromonas pelagimontana]QJR81383.1 DNA mismatch repair endonuclease MutL [Alteromonas pelagimontana]